MMEHTAVNVSVHTQCASASCVNWAKQHELRGMSVHNLHTGSGVVGGVATWWCSSALIAAVPPVAQFHLLCDAEWFLLTLCLL